MIYKSLHLHMRVYKIVDIKRVMLRKSLDKKFPLQ